MPGPPPKPGAIRRLEGNPGKRPIPEEPRIGSMVVEVHEFPAPATLPDKVADVWDEVVPDLVAIGLVRSIDATMLEAMCRAIARARECEAIIDDEGVMIDGHRGSVIHPAFRVAERSWKTALTIARDYGMTAVGRLKVGAAVLQQKSLADELRDALDGPASPEEVSLEARLVEVLGDDPPEAKARKRAR